MEDQLAIPMPVIGVQVDILRQPGGGPWQVVHRLCRQDVGWRVEARYSGLVWAEAEDVAANCLAGSLRES